ncbi:hypothetical protein D1B31_04080 [Neobacillus notoginsengisoli]|uniref:DUF3221 domain-containing protein n=1 Tax=Neobacillus notoginsengisoli TaxID=1578198 RepID=A0A417YZ27_9BACI|nr:hypothetical protein [Neobacillus notoginsengisoli]RHW42767.1 hypothetical protein D1B31_04080 [Neobacillus notoginsengisoli]
MKSYGKVILVLMLLFSLVSLSGCFGKDKATDANRKTTETGKNNDDKETAEQNGEDSETAEESSDQAESSEQGSDSVKENTGQAKPSDGTSKNTKTTAQSSDKGKTAGQSTSKGKETNQSSTKGKDSNKGSNKGKQTNTTPKAPDKKAPDTQTVGEKEVIDFVLENTRIVQISSISKRSKEEFPDLGPFFVIRGMDLRGEVSEVWIKDMKIFEMETQKN